MIIVPINNFKEASRFLIKFDASGFMNLGNQEWSILNRQLDSQNYKCNRDFKNFYKETG